MTEESVDAPVEETLEQRKERKRSTVLVHIDGWPIQDPGRPMVWGWRPSPQKAAREVKRLKARFPENVRWSVEPLTATQARAIKLKPFNLRDFQRRMGGMAVASDVFGSTS